MNNECININSPLTTPDEYREYKRIWAEKKRREQGCQIKAEMTKSKDPEYLKKRSQIYRSNLSEEKKEELLILMSCSLKHEFTQKSRIVFRYGNRFDLLRG